MTILLPVLLTLAVWWASTGLILVLHRLPARTYGLSMAVATVAMALGLAGIAVTADDAGTAAAYASFGSGLLVWAWTELAFLTGTITGARREPCPPGLGGWPRFVLATRAILHHELAIAALGIACLALSWGAVNQVGALTFGVLWVMRLSAKLNIFLGVRNFGEALLPAHLRYLTSYFRRARFNALFPVSIVGGALLTGWFVASALAAVPGSGAQAGHLMLATLTALAVIEHAFLLLPLSLDALWTGRRAVPAPLRP